MNKFLTTLFLALLSIPLQPGRAQESNESAPEKEVPPGSLLYLDFQNGFRDAKFGKTPEEIGGIEAKGKDFYDLSTRYSRAGDELKLNDFPLNYINYFFYKNKLRTISIYSELKPGSNHNAKPDGFTDFLVSLYGNYTNVEEHLSPEKEVRTYTWHTRKLTLIYKNTVYIQNNSYWATYDIEISDNFLNNAEKNEAGQIKAWEKTKTSDGRTIN